VARILVSVRGKWARCGHTFGHCAQSVPIEMSRCAPNRANTLPLYERFRAGLDYGKQLILKEMVWIPADSDR